MTPLPKISIFVIACLFLGDVEAEVKTISEGHLDFPDETLFFNTDDLNVDNQEFGVLIYALCKTVGEQKMQEDMRCRIVIHSQTLPEKSCEISLKVTNTSFGERSEFIRLINFGSQKVAVLWHEEAKIKCRIMDTMTCSQIKEVVLMEGIIWMNTLALSTLIPLEDSFEVIIAEPMLLWPIFRVDSKGEITSYQKAFATRSRSSQFTSVLPKSRSKGYLQSDIDINVHRDEVVHNVFLIQPDGELIHLLKHCGVYYTANFINFTLKQ